MRPRGRHRECPEPASLVVGRRLTATAPRPTEASKAAVCYVRNTSNSGRRLRANTGCSPTAPRADQVDPFLLFEERADCANAGRSLRSRSTRREERQPQLRNPATPGAAASPTFSTGAAEGE